MYAGKCTVVWAGVPNHSDMIDFSTDKTADTFLVVEGFVLMRNSFDL